MWRCYFSYSFFHVTVYFLKESCMRSLVHKADPYTNFFPPILFKTWIVFCKKVIFSPPPPPPSRRKVRMTFCSLVPAAEGEKGFHHRGGGNIPPPPSLFPWSIHAAMSTSVVPSTKMDLFLAVTWCNLWASKLWRVAICELPSLWQWFNLVNLMHTCIQKCQKSTTIFKAQPCFVKQT